MYVCFCSTVHTSINVIVIEQSQLLSQNFNCVYELYVQNVCMYSIYVCMYVCMYGNLQWNAYRIPSIRRRLPCSGDKPCSSLWAG